MILSFIFNHNPADKSAFFLHHFWHIKVIYRNFSYYSMSHFSSWIFFHIVWNYFPIFQVVLKGFPIFQVELTNVQLPFFQVQWYSNFSNYVKWFSNFSSCMKWFSNFSSCMKWFSNFLSWAYQFSSSNFSSWINF